MFLVTPKLGKIRKPQTKVASLMKLCWGIRWRCMFWTKLNSGLSGAFYIDPSIWNKLPLVIKRSGSLNSFKHNARSYYLTKIEQASSLYSYFVLMCIFMFCCCYLNTLLLNCPISLLLFFLQLFDCVSNIVLHWRFLFQKRPQWNSSFLNFFCYLSHCNICKLYWTPSLGWKGPIK